MDIDNIHSSLICHSCTMQIINLKTRPITLNAISKAHKKAEKGDGIFCQFDENVTVKECSLCSHVDSLRPNARTGTNRQADIELDH